MLKDDLFSIISIKRESNSCEIILELYAMHKIFEGHFPGQPLLPGACMLQMVKEVTETVLDKKLRLKKAGNLKFLMLVDPGKNRILQMNLTHNIVESGTVNVSANLSNGTAVCFKFTGTFQE